MYRKVKSLEMGPQATTQLGGNIWLAGKNSS